jgi:hypothetical protein
MPDVSFYLRVDAPVVEFLKRRPQTFTSSEGHAIWINRKQPCPPD